MSPAWEDADETQIWEGGKLVVSTRRPATLPNCDRCGRFTSSPVIRRWCTGGNSGAHTCHESLTCQRCDAFERGGGCG